MSHEGRPQAEEFEDRPDTTPESPEERAYVARGNVGAHKRCLKGDRVWLKHPNGAAPYLVDVEEAQFVAGTTRMEYRLKYNKQVLVHEGNDWFVQECVFKDYPPS
ncbi:hypothetical protein LTR97_009434 [Elasticomyces elasticus]|uniref:Uncharacterized protein n=1 Tax=Elasticomyces elasticus TaxID=574655 RepID=A0AAN7VWM6_9PEZI|nr:hypothetical protein LTR97_009434 [Elasticomyces elasticus]KAK5728589.1 hypothetical protein LTR15_001726 [Elasticomyces elasticus]